ncbi:hypothetical protein A1O1_01227 [Capronia coronata CBS 617.96]|uniref:Transcription factor domain-containing protein n=1 Tax=Capronia coronata CBS 617.96 TaxID=1182541 RepID=W9Z3E0_9EURO|nr:uncharacterized protein A1O1_01227 [Capronia coronata CBS 617.96]EXJ96101.1 hypothetical protein A1O1_01227 [Capronia coronata CBS 617.96]
MGARSLYDADTRSDSRHGSQEGGSERTESRAPSHVHVHGHGHGSKTSHVLVPTILDSHRRDLFASYPAMGGRHSMQSVDEYVYIQRNEELLLKIRPDVQHPVLSVLFPMSMQDPGLFKCFLVGAQSLYEWRRFPQQAKPSQTMMRLQSEAISSLQKRLTLPAAHLDDGLVISVLHLMVADACLRDLPSLKSHLGGIRQIIALRGGLGSSPSHLAIRALLTTVEFYIALGQYLRVSPDDPVAVPSVRIQYVPHPFPPDVCRYISKLPVGLAEAALSGRLSVQCIKLLTSVADWAPLVDDPQSSSEPDCDPQIRYCRLFCEPREYSRNAVILLLSLQRSGIPPGLEHVICLGLAITVRHLSGENRTNFFDGTTLDALISNVKAIDTPTLPESEVIIWLALVVNWRTQLAGPLANADDLLDYVIDSFPAARTWKAVSVIARKFFWFDRFRLDWEKCWQCGIQRFRQRLIAGK